MPPWTLTHGVDRAPHRVRARTVTAVIGGAVLLSGCQADGVVPGGSSPPVDGNAKPQLADPDGLVRSHTFLLPAPDRDVVPYLDEPVDEHLVVLDVDGDTGTRVVWTGLPCQIAPTVEVTGDPQRLRITVDRGPQVLAEAEACESSENYFLVDLTFAEAAASAAVDVRIS